jgi:hypothetical protein
MKRLLLSCLCFGVLAVDALAAEPPSAQTLARPTDASAPLRSGIDMGRRGESFFWGAQAASLPRSAAGRTHDVRGKLPRTAGWQPALPSRS